MHIKSSCFLPAALCGLVLSSVGSAAFGQAAAVAVEQPPAVSAVQETSPEQTADAGQESEEDETGYIRIKRNDRRLAMALQTSIIRFGNSADFPGTAVDLIGAIHLAEPEYYDRLNKQFSEYEVLLFEAVMPEEAVTSDLRPGGGKAGRSALSDEQEWTDAKVGLAAVSALQLGMKDALGLEFQLTGVNYTASNFVHADMTQEEFEESMRRRGESFAGMMLSEMGKAAVNGQNTNPLAQQLDLMLSMLTDDRMMRVRRIAAVELAKADSGEAFAGPDGTSTIITERNKKALKVLRSELQKGRRRIGIFYGAGHFADMEKRLVSEFGYERLSEEWITAWKLRAPTTNEPSAPKE